MNTKLLQLRYPNLVFLVLLSACSGGNVDVAINGPNIPITPIVQTDEAITAHGVITALGNITVNDVRYTAAAATITLNGQAGTLAELKLGQIVTVRGQINGFGLSGTATGISHDCSLIGPVESLDADNDRMTVMGQTVTTDPDTRFGTGIDPLSYAGLSAGDIVQVSGYVDAAGVIRATRIAPDTANSELQIIGKVAGLDLANLLFTINRLTVDYGNAMLIEVPGGAPANGMMIKAVGKLSGGLFTVERLTAAATITGNTGRRTQTAGLITRFNSAADFDIGNTAVRVDTGTAFVNGDADDLALNAEIVIDGEFASGGRISANRITFGHLDDETTTLSFALSDFSEISIPTVFNLNVSQGQDYVVEVNVDATAADRIDVTQTGSRLNFALLVGDGNIRTLEANVTMPVLDKIDLGGVVNATVNNFTQTQMTVDVGGVSRLHGNGLTIENLVATVSGVSQLSFGEIHPIANADIEISGVSQATLNMDVGSTLTGSVGTGQGTGVSALYYFGTNVDIDVTTDFNSSVVRLGATKPW